MKLGNGQPLAIGSATSQPPVLLSLAENAVLCQFCHRSGGRWLVVGVTRLGATYVDACPVLVVCFPRRAYPVSSVGGYSHSNRHVSGAQLQWSQSQCADNYSYVMLQRNCSEIPGCDGAYLRSEDRGIASV